MSTYKVILKEKAVYVSVEADTDTTDTLDANYLTLKKGNKDVAVFLVSQLQGFFKE